MRKAMGLLICAIDIDDGKLAHATRLGAIVINAKTGDLQRRKEGEPAAELRVF